MATNTYTICTRDKKSLLESARLFYHSKFTQVFTHPSADQFSELSSDQKPPPKPPLKRPGPVKSSVTLPEKATEYTKHDSSSPSLGVNFKWILFQKKNGF